MAVIRSIRKLVWNPKSILAFSTPTHLSNHPFLCHNPNRVLSPFSKWIPLQASLFLSSPPWKLSQSTTPLYLHSDLIFIFPKLTPTLPKLGLGLASVPNLSSTKKQGRIDLDVDVDVGRTKLVDSFVNWPNFISFSRLLSGPLLGWMIVQEMYIPAFVGLAISGATDWLDGYVARKMGINSVVGSYLDPLADKVLIGCVALAMVDKNLLQPELVGLIVLRDVALVGGAVYKRASSLNWEWKSWFDFFNLDGTRPQKVEPLFLSKVNTVFQLILVTAALLQPDFGTPETESYITYLSWLVASTTVASTAAYGVQHLRSRSLTVVNKL